MDTYTEKEKEYYKKLQEKGMDLEKKILSDITVHMKYARYLEDKNRRENWNELVTRNMEMHIKKFPSLEQEIRENYKFVFDKKVLPSMRSMQFGGKPIEVSPNRIFNCAYAPADDPRVFGEIMFLLLGGTGVGYSVQKHHVDNLPEIRKPSSKRTRRFLIGDSIEGWADAVKALMMSHFKGTSKLRFDFSDIRPKGARLVTSGGKAPGPQPLKECLVKVEGILDAKENGDKLSPIEVHDIICHIADAVLAGGIRRAALISLFSADDEDMLSAKAGAWWELNPQRGRANNSVVVMRHKIDKPTFMNLWKRVEESRSGEPGFYFSNDKDWGCNPCCLDGSTEIETNSGTMTIEQIVSKVNEGQEIKVLSFDENTGSMEFELVEEGLLTRQDADVIKIETEDGQELILTPDHRVFTENRGYVEAAHLTEEDILLFVE